MMKKIILGLACAAALLGTTVQAKEIRLASDFTYPPFNYKTVTVCLSGLILR